MKKNTTSTITITWSLIKNFKVFILNDEKRTLQQCLVQITSHSSNGILGSSKDNLIILFFYHFDGFREIIIEDTNSRIFK